MNLLQRLKNTIEWFNSLDRNTLNYARYGLFTIIVADMLGLWYFLHLKALSIAILMVSMVGLALILIRERNLDENDVLNMKGGNNNGKKRKKVQEEAKKKQETTSISDFLDTTLEQAGLPDSEEYQKRLDKAYGTI